jgi:hypothetical protein
LSPAADRLLDAALEQLFKSPVARAPVSRSPRWLLAAMLLLGGAVVATVMWQVRNVPRDETQDPQATPIPAEVSGEGKAAIEALPTTTTNLVAKLVDPRDLAVVARFEGLRALRLWPLKSTFLGISTGYHDAWSEPRADLLQPLAELLHLEVLALPHRLAVTPGLLAPLAGHPSLREIQLERDAVVIDEVLVGALARIPQLRSLHLRFVPLSGGTLRALAKLPLTSLQLDFCHGLDAEGWQALLTMRSLQRLAFTDWSWDTVPGRTDVQPGWRPTPDDLRLLHRLPGLRCLELLGCSVDDEQLAALPDTLTTLHVLGTQLTPEGFAALRRFVKVRDLAIDAKPRGNTIADLFAPDSDAAADAFATPLRSLRLRTLRYSGALTPAVVQAIGAQGDLRDLHITSKQPAATAGTDLLRELTLRRLAWRAPVTTELLAALAAQPHLRELDLTASDLGSVAALATAPGLERLALTQEGIGKGIAAASLAPLAGCPALRELVVRVLVTRGAARPDQAELQRAVGDRIRLQLHETEFAEKR